MRRLATIATWLLVVAVAACGCVAPGEQELDDQDPHQPGDELGSFAITGKLGADDCGADALNAPQTWSFQVKLSREGTTLYWLNGRLRVSPEEQVRFLRRFYDDALPVAARHMTGVRTALLQDPGAVENASGVHPLGVTWRPGLSLSAKTGATMAEDGTNVSWLVGRA